MYPNEVPAQNAHPDLVSEGRLPRVLVGCEGVPPDRSPRLRDPKVHSIDGHEAVVAEKSSCSGGEYAGEERGAGVSRRR